MKSLSWTMGLTGLGILVLIALLSPWVVPHDPDAVDLTNRLAEASSAHWLGTDHLGRDMLSRLMMATSVSLGASLATLALMLLVGVGLGGLAALAGGRVESVIMRVCDVFMTFPTVVLALFMVALLGTGLVNVIIAIAMTHWAWYARMTRSLVYTLKHSPYLQAAKMAGVPPWLRFCRHVLPTVLVQLLVLASLDIGHVLLHVSGLSFLGLGVESPTPEWGVMINDARQFIWTHPQLVIWPGLMILITVMSFNLLGDALRDRLDPNWEAKHA